MHRNSLSEFLDFELLGKTGLDRFGKSTQEVRKPDLNARLDAPLAIAALSSGALALSGNVHTYSVQEVCAPSWDALTAARAYAGRRRPWSCTPYL